LAKGASEKEKMGVENVNVAARLSQFFDQKDAEISEQSFPTSLHREELRKLCWLER
jgi:hypothetical protein